MMNSKNTGRLDSVSSSLQVQPKSPQEALSSRNDGPHSSLDTIKSSSASDTIDLNDSWDQIQTNNSRRVHDPADESNADDSASSSNGEFFPLNDSDRAQFPSSLSPSTGVPRSTSTNREASEYSDSADIIQEEDTTNERLLCTAFVSFMSFALVELSFAVVAGSQAMMGDAAAMIVDALTYLFNWVAERRKTDLDSLVLGMNNPVRTRRKLELHTEIIPPLVSVATLIVVIVLVLRRSIHILILDRHRSRDQQGNPNVGLMMIFSVLNLFLDGLNVACFARANHLAGFSVASDDDEEEETDVQCTNLSDPNHRRHRTKQNYRQLDGQTSDGLDDSGLELSNVQSSAHEYHISDNGNTCIVSRPSHISPPVEHGGPDGLFRRGQHEHANLNMCSAFTHVFADTLRSVAVIVAAGVAEAFPSTVTPEEADATAAVVVSAMILLSLIPLLQGLYRSLSELQAIQSEEKAESVMSIPR
jgi:Co/Zn/Cd efflux system component